MNKIDESIHRVKYVLMIYIGTIFMDKNYLSFLHRVMRGCFETCELKERTTECNAGRPSLSFHTREVAPV